MRCRHLRENVKWLRERGGGAGGGGGGDEVPTPVEQELHHVRLDEAPEREAPQVHVVAEVHDAEPPEVEERRRVRAQRALREIDALVLREDLDLLELASRELEAVELARCEKHLEVLERGTQVPLAAGLQAQSIEGRHRIGARNEGDHLRPHFLDEVRVAEVD